MTCVGVSPGCAAAEVLVLADDDLVEGAPPASAPYSRWSSSRRSPGIPMTPIARPVRAAAVPLPLPMTPARVCGSTIIRFTKSASWRMPSTLWQ